MELAIYLIIIAVAVYAIAQHFFISPPLKPIPSDKLKAILEKESEFVVNKLALWVRAGDSRVITPKVLKNIKEREYFWITKRAARAARQAHREQQIEVLGALQAKGCKLKKVADNEKVCP